MFFRNGINVKPVEFHDTVSFEYMVLKFCGSNTLIVILLYRPPKPLTNFFMELNELLTLACAMSHSVILLGDFNIHVDTDCAESHEFLSVIQCLNYEQHVKFPTHSQGHRLDLVCTTGLQNVSVIGSQIELSDHSFIEVNCDLPLKFKRKSTITYRNCHDWESSARFTMK